jgi:hypothetical protein
MPNKQQASILSNHQRQVISGNKDVSDSSRRGIRSRVRRRVQRGLADLRILFHHADGDELSKMFDNQGRYTDGLAAPPYIPSAIAFILRAENADDPDVYPSLGAEQPAFAEFSRSVEAGIETWLAAEKQLDAKVNIEITISDAQPTAALLEEIAADDDELADLRDLATLELAGVDRDRLAEIAPETVGAGETGDDEE